MNVLMMCLCLINKQYCLLSKDSLLIFEINKLM